MIELYFAIRIVLIAVWLIVSIIGVIKIWHDYH